jgi:hypothetical protein
MKAMRTGIALWVSGAVAWTAVNAAGDPSSPSSDEASALGVPYAVVDTGQDRCFDNSREILYPSPGDPFDGQDAQMQGFEPAYRDNGDATVSDLNTGLMWQKTPDFVHKSTFAEACSGAKACRLGGHADWRLPTVKELYSLIDFRGYCARPPARSRPYLDTNVFAFAWGNEAEGERGIDALYWSSTEYKGRTMQGNPAAFGVNFADGWIKGCPTVSTRGEMRQFVRYVRGNPKYGINDFVDNGDGTVTDRATGLMWQKGDSRSAMDWQAALAYSAALELAGHDDWRLPNAKELQSLVDYTRALDALDPARRGPAINPVFSVATPESWYWTGTTHLADHACWSAVYLCFGQAMGTVGGVKMNVHGAGAQRSDPKAGDRMLWRCGRGPQGDEVRILNYVRCVRGGGVKRKISGPPLEGYSGDDSRVRLDGGAGFIECAERSGGALGEEATPGGPPPARRGAARKRTVFDVIFRNDG